MGDSTPARPGAAPPLQLPSEAGATTPRLSPAPAATPASAGGRPAAAGDEAAPPLPAAPLPPPPAALAVADQWVHVSLRLMNWAWLQQSVVLKATTPLHALKRLLVERHGRLASLVLHLGEVAPETEMRDEAKSLHAYGLVGGAHADVAAAPPQVIYYDFLPYHADE